MKKEQQTLVVIIVCFVVFIFVYFSLLLSPIRKKIVEVKNTISKESDRLREAKILEEQLPQLKQETQMLRLQIEQLKQKLPTSPNIPELIKIIGKEAQYYNIKISNLTPKEINSSPKEFNEIPFSINFMTNYHSLGQFLASIAQGKRIFAAQNLQLNYSPTAQTDLNLSGSCILIAYTLKK
jgi:Tfp pilus assembly protein PilO